jgi:hypothetical protein
VERLERCEYLEVLSSSSSSSEQSSSSSSSSEHQPYPPNEWGERERERESIRNCGKPHEEKRQTK